MKTRTEANVVIYELDEEYSSLNPPVLANLQNELFVAIADVDVPRVIFDMTRTKFFGSEFLELLFRVWHRTNRLGGKFAVANATGPALDILQTTHLDQLWPTFPTVAEALAATAGSE